MAKSEKYSKSMRILHWLMAACLFGMIYSGWHMVDIPGSDPIKWEWYGYHKSVGVCLIALIFMRMVLRRTTNIPEASNKLSKNMKFLSGAGHSLLYLFMLIIPIDGFLMSQFGGHPISVFGLKIPQIVPAIKSYAAIYHEIHEIAPYILLALIAAHLLATIYHYIVDKVNMLSRMT